jgi:hypothetical protein
MTAKEIQEQRENDAARIKIAENLLERSSTLNRSGDALTLLAFIELARFHRETEGAAEPEFPLEDQEEKTDPGKPTDPATTRWGLRPPTYGAK